MNRAEVRVVKRRLESYRDLIALAEEKDLIALSLSESYYRMAAPSCLPLESKPHVESPTPMESKYLEIFSDQAEVEKTAREYRSQAKRMAEFIKQLPNSESLEFVYINGMSYKEAADKAGVTSEAIRQRIDRILLDETPEKARAYGLL